VVRLRQSGRVDRRLGQLIDLLDRTGAETAGMSIRLPANLRDAAALASEMGFAESTTELTVRGIRDALDACAQRAILDEHYRSHPEVGPDLAEIALAAAELDGNALASRPDVIGRAAEDVMSLRNDPTPYDVLLYAAGVAAASAA
jgi:hypothetical protein